MIVSRRAAAVIVLTSAALAFLPCTARAAGFDIPVGQFRQYTSITAGLANAFSASKIKIDPGVYTECPTVTGLVLLQIVGKKGVVIDATGCDAGLTINDGEGITVKGLTIVGAKQGVVVKAAAERVLINKTTIQDSGSGVLETGVRVESAPDVTLDKVTILDAKLRGVQVLSAARTIVRKSTIAGGAGLGVLVDLGTSATIVKNTIFDLGATGIAFAHSGGGGAADSLIASNKISGVPGGISVAGVNNVVEKNKLTDLTNVGIFALGPGGTSTYRKNTIVRAALAGIRAANGGDTFEKNTVKETSGNGLDVTGDANHFIGNKVTAATGTGVRVQASASGNIFEGTSASKAGTDGFLVQGTGNTFTKATASKSGGLDLNDPAGGATTNVYTDCKFKTSNVP